MKRLILLMLFLSIFSTCFTEIIFKEENILESCENDSILVEIEIRLMSMNYIDTVISYYVFVVTQYRLDYIEKQEKYWGTEKENIFRSVVGAVETYKQWSKK